MKLLLSLFTSLLLLFSPSLFAKDLVIKRDGVTLTLTQESCTNPIVLFFARSLPLEQKHMDNLLTGKIEYQGRENGLCYVVNPEDVNQIFIIDEEDGPVGVVELAPKN